MHCDTVVLNQGWIDLLIGVAESRNSGFVGTQLSNYFIQRQSVNFIPEWCVLVTRECWEDCGPWPEELPLVGHSFIMTMRAQHKGYKPTAMTNPVVHHYRAPSFNPNEYERISQKAMTIIPKLLTEAQA
jgi:GT2 family glycosyltransferase